MTQAVLSPLTPEDIAAINATTRQFTALVVAGDFDGASQLYTPDAVVMPPHHPLCNGRAAARQWMASIPRVTRFDIDNQRVDGRADLAYVSGVFSVTLQTPEGAVEDVGKFLEIRRRQPDGSWLIEADIFNSDRP
jgi:ketosteroid isomerase-like protein